MDAMIETPVRLKYAHVERAQRFLLSALPGRLRRVPAKTICDRYLIGTRLRLRSVDEPGRDLVLKLGQKIPMAGPPPTAVAHTTMYLDRDDYDALVAIPAKELCKSRRVVSENGARIAVDELHGELEGLVLAEVDIGEHGIPLPASPIPSVAEVTEDHRFTGRNLAEIGSAAPSILIREFMS